MLYRNFLFNILIGTLYRKLRLTFPMVMMGGFERSRPSRTPPIAHSRTNSQCKFLGQGDEASAAAFLRENFLGDAIAVFYRPYGAKVTALTLFSVPKLLEGL